MVFREQSVCVIKSLVSYTFHVDSHVTEFCVCCTFTQPSYTLGLSIGLFTVLHEQLKRLSGVIVTKLAFPALG
jgi:hypothetical protein